MKIFLLTNKTLKSYTEFMRCLLNLFLSIFMMCQILSGSENAGRGIYGPPDTAGLFETILAINSTTQKGGDRLQKTSDITDILGRFAGSTQPVSLEEWRQQVKWLEMEAKENGEAAAAALPVEVPELSGEYFLYNDAWIHLPKTPFEFRQSLLDMLGGTGKLLLDISQVFTEMPVRNPIFLFQQDEIQSPPCVTPLTERRRHYEIVLEKVVPGGAWVRRMPWATVRLSKLPSGFFLLEVLSPLEPGLYALCVENDVFAFTVSESSRFLPTLKF